MISRREPQPGSTGGTDRHTRGDRAGQRASLGLDAPKARKMPAMVSSRVILVSILCCAAAGCGGDDGDPDGTAATCARYCATIATSCTGVEAQYTGADQCMAACQAFDQGAEGAQSGNSLECRNYHAGAALGDPTTHCVHAGPGGAGACGNNCAGFCAIVLSACAGDDEAYASEAECLTACAGFADTEKYDISDLAGDTLACRLYHAQVATSDPGTHCAHTLPVSSTCN
jgi:hypothetical protein